MKRRNLYLVVFISFLVVGLVYWLASANKRYSWRENYRHDNDGPYGTLVIQQLFENEFPADQFVALNEPINQALLTAQDSAAAYVFIGDDMFMDSLSIETLLNFVEQGNQAFLICRSIPSDLSDAILDDLYCDDTDYSAVRYYWKDSIALHLAGYPADTFQFNYLKWNRLNNYGWAYYDPEGYCDSFQQVKPLGYQRQDSTFGVQYYEVGHGAGQFFFHHTPLAFSNISLLDSQALHYVNKVFDVLDANHIYWDNYTRIPANLSDLEMPESGITLSSQGPLKYILSQPALSWAWYILLLLGVLYLWIGSKRKQRIIPVLEGNKNDSLEFLATLSRLFYLQKNHRQLSMLQIKLFKSFVRRRYGITLKEANEERLVQQLAQKSDIDIDHLEKLILIYRNIEHASFVSENTLATLHQSIDYFYKNCK